MLDASRPVVVPPFVPRMLRMSLDDLGRVLGLLARSDDVEWVSDVAALYHARLEQARRLVFAVETRVREAATTVHILSRTS